MNGENMPIVALAILWILALGIFGYSSPESQAYMKCDEAIADALSAPSLKLVRERIVLAEETCKLSKLSKITVENLQEINKIKNFAELKKSLQEEKNRR